MKIKKISTLVLSLILVMSIFLTPAYATPIEEESDDIIPLPIPENTITPLWNNISSIHPGLSSSGKTLYADVLVVSENSTSSITGTMYLEKEVATDDWDSVKSWSIQGTGTAIREGTYTGTYGSTYRVRVKVFVGGESATAYSYEVTL